MGTVTGDAIVRPNRVIIASVETGRHQIMTLLGGITNNNNKLQKGVTIIDDTCDGQGSNH